MGKCHYVSAGTAPGIEQAVGIGWTEYVAEQRKLSLHAGRPIDAPFVPLGRGGNLQPI